jgi:hypothetical protein
VVCSAPAVLEVSAFGAGKAKQIESVTTATASAVFFIVSVFLRELDQRSKSILSPGDAFKKSRKGDSWAGKQRGAKQLILIGRYRVRVQRGSHFGVRGLCRRFGQRQLVTAFVTLSCLSDKG